MASATIYFKNKPNIISTYTVGGPKEGTSTFGKHVHKILSDERCGENTFEKGERKMLTECIEGVIKKSGKKERDINAMVSGDLLNQIISASFSARSFDFPYIGVYNACSTFSEALALGATLVDGGYYKNVVAATGSHFATAERQYRYPLELGSTRPPQSQWTVTGAGSALISSDVGSYPQIVSATFGKVIDYGVTDANNMGAAMAPAAYDTLFNLFKDTKTKPCDYDLILTGDLGALGSRLFKKLMSDSGYDVKNHSDCGEMVYNIEEEEYQGGSGAGCSAIVFGSYIYEKLKRKEINRMIFMATGALLSSLSTQQGESIPAISHAVVIESQCGK